MKRTVVLALILVVILTGVLGGSVAAREEGQISADDAFIALAFSSSRPSGGFDILENIHTYMWKSVYVMGTVDYSLAKTDAGQFAFISTWQGEGHLSIPSGSDFLQNDLPAITFDNVPIVGDAILHLAPGVELPDSDFELVGNVCGIQKFHSYVQTGAAFPIICIPADGRLRIRKLPVFISWLDE